MTWRQILECPLDVVECFDLQQGGVRGGEWTAFFIYFKVFQRVGKFVVRRGERRELHCMPHPGARAAIKVADGVLQDTLKQERQFIDRIPTIFFGQTHHAVLNDIEGGILVAHSKHGLFEGAALDAGKKIGKL